MRTNIPQLGLEVNTQFLSDMDDGDKLETMNCTDCIGIFIHDGCLGWPIVYTIWET